MYKVITLHGIRHLKKTSFPRTLSGEPILKGADTINRLIYRHLPASRRYGGRRPTEGGARSAAGESFHPCPWGQPRSGGGLNEVESLHPSTRKPGQKGRAISQCGQRDNYRTNFEDFRAVYLFNIQFNSSITHSPVFAGPEK